MRKIFVQLLTQVASENNPNYLNTQNRRQTNNLFVVCPDTYTFNSRKGVQPVF